MIHVDFNWGAMATNYVFVEELGNPCRLLVRQSPSLNILGHVVNACDYVGVAWLRRLQRANQVYAHLVVHSIGCSSLGSLNFVCIIWHCLHSFKYALTWSLRPHHQ